MQNLLTKPNPVTHSLIKNYMRHHLNPNLPLTKLADRADHTLKLLCGMKRNAYFHWEKFGKFSAECIGSLSTESPVIIYLHGGGYACGSPSTHRRMLWEIFNLTHYPIIAVDYPLAPKHMAPAPVHAIVDVYKNLLTRGYQPEKIIIGGDSAGGGLTLASMLYMKESKLPLPQGAFVFSPWTDLTVSGESIYQNEANDIMLSPELICLWSGLYAGNMQNNPLCSPLFGDLNGLPPLLIQVSKDEMLYHDSTRFFDRAEKSGVEVELQEWPRLPHVWQLFPHLIPEAKESLEQVANFCDHVFGQEIRIAA